MLAIAHATEADVPALAVLLEELDRLYGATDAEPRDRREEQIGRALFGKVPAAYALLAKDSDEMVGLASYSFLWPAAGTTTSLFLKELYVRQARQRQGIGRRLMQSLCGIAVGAGCSRVEWQTEDANERAMQFYKAMAAPIQPGKLLYRLEGTALRSLADG